MRNIFLIALLMATVAHADDLVTYTTTSDLNGNLTTTGSDGSRAESAKCQTCARPSYETTFSDGSKATTTQAATNDSYTTTVRK